VMTLKEIIEIVESIAPKYPSMICIGVFGSYARGDADKDSDIDLLYRYDYDDKDSTDQLLDFVEDVTTAVEPIDVDFVWERHMLKKNTEFATNVFKDLIWIYHANQPDK